MFNKVNLMQNLSTNDTNFQQITNFDDEFEQFEIVSRLCVFPSLNDRVYRKFFYFNNDVWTPLPTGANTLNKQILKYLSL